MSDGNGAKSEETTSASDDLKEQEKLGLIYIYRQGGQNRFEMTIPLESAMEKLFAIDLLNNVMKAIITAPIKKNKPKIIQAPADFFNRLRKFKSKRR